MSSVVETAAPTSARPSGTQPRRTGAGLQRLSTALFFVLIALVLIDGWRNRNDQLLTAESGIGYALGIIGGSMMLLMLAYSLRKRLRWLHGLGRIKHWFRAHMLLGILGPTCILYHANFGTGSLNSNVALACMLLVAGSGLVGRYIYSRIHYGLYGRRATLEQLDADLAQLRSTLGTEVAFAEPLLQHLDTQQARLRSVPSGLLAAIAYHLTIGLRSRNLRRRLERGFSALLRRERATGTLDPAAARRLRRRFRTILRAHLATVRRVGEMHFYERLFSLWHILHVPLFLMLMVSGIVHVVAVHMY